MPAAIQIPAGVKLGRLTILGPARTASGRRAFLCRCDCGKETTVDGSHLRSGHTTSCGCLHREVAADLARTNPLIAEYRTSDLRREQSRQSSPVHGLSHHPHYHRWVGMMNRCTNPNHDGYRNYGGRGIAVCAAWRDVAVFCAWIDENLGPCPAGKSLDRIDNDGNYEPGNVRYAAWSTQIRNSRSAKLTWEDAEQIRRRHAAGGETCESLARKYGVTPGNVSLILAGKTWRRH